MEMAYKMVVTPAIMYGLEAIVLTKRDERAECYRAEDVKISSGVTRMDEIKNEHIRGTAVFGVEQDLWT